MVGPEGEGVGVISQLSAANLNAAYGRAAEAWRDGTDAAYRRYGEALVAAYPEPLKGLRIIDIGAGSGAVSVALRTAGADVVATDASTEMLTMARQLLPGLSTVVADATALPFENDSFDGATSGFCVNHLAEPHRLLSEAARVVRPGGFVLATSFLANDDHPVKEAVESAARQVGWARPAWYDDMQIWSALTDSPPGLESMAEKAGLDDIHVQEAVVDTCMDAAAEQVRWRLGMAQFAGFVEDLESADRYKLIAMAEAKLGNRPQPLVRTVLILSSRAPA